MNRVKLNLPSNGSGSAPDPTAAVVEIDGMPIKHVNEISIYAAAGARTTVALKFYAEIEGVVDVDAVEQTDLSSKGGG